jgi:hypothetical protein
MGVPIADIMKASRMHRRDLFLFSAAVRQKMGTAPLIALAWASRLFNSYVPIGEARK